AGGAGRSRSAAGARPRPRLEGRPRSVFCPRVASPRRVWEGPMEAVLGVLEGISDFVWGPYLLIPLLLGTGLYLTIRLGGLQFTRFAPAMRLGLVKRRDAGSEGDISQFQALTTALAATVGTGNIVGVATAIGIGGPGALLWMWVTGLLGMVTKYAEAYVGVGGRGTGTAGEQDGGPEDHRHRGIRGSNGEVVAVEDGISTRK